MALQMTKVTISDKADAVCALHKACDEIELEQLSIAAQISVLLEKQLILSRKFIGLKNMIIDVMRSKHDDVPS
jgi:hypothetical protein